MQHITRQRFNAYVTRIAQVNNYGEFRSNEAITYTPQAQQRLYQALGENADFLQKINHIPVTAQVGQRVGVGISKPCEPSGASNPTTRGWYCCYIKFYIVGLVISRKRHRRQRNLILNWHGNGLRKY